MLDANFLRTHTRLDPDAIRQDAAPLGASTGSYAETSQYTLARTNQITPDVLRKLAEQSSAVRPAVEGIKREVAYMRWDVVKRDEEIPDSDDLRMRQDELRRLFNQPNKNGFPLANLLSMLMDDLLILDRFTIEVVFNRLHTKVVELWERDAATIMPDINGQGVWEGYTQRVGNVSQKIIKFKPDEIIFGSMFPRSNRPTGTPIIETIINEVASLLFMIQHIGVTFTEDEIPPGILWLGEGISQEIFSRVTASLKQGRRRKFEDLKLRVYGGGQVAPKWVELKRANRDEQMMELRRDIEDIVWINFGVLPARMGRTDSVNRANIEQQAKWQDSALIGPILKMLEYAITLGVIDRGYGYKDLIWRLIPDREETEAYRAEVANKILGAQVPVFTINGVRHKLFDEAPWDIEAANKPFIMTPSGPIFLEDMHPKGNVTAVDADAGWRRTAEALRRMEAVRDLPLRRAAQNRFTPDDTQTLEDAYGKVMSTAWDEAMDKIVDGVEANAQEDDEGEASVDDPESRREEAAAVMLLMLWLFNDAAGKAFSIAAATGLEAASSVDDEADVGQRQVRDIVVDEQAANKAWVQGELFSDVTRDLNAAIRAKHASKLDLVSAIRKSFDRQAYRLKRYSHRVYSIGTNLYVRALDATGRYYWVWHDTGDDAECSACIAAKAASPFNDRRDIPFMPGNSPVCDGSCRCELESVLIKDRAE